MRWQDGAAGYGLVTIGLHWLTFALLVALYALGWMFPEMPRGPERDALAGLHFSLGLALLIVAVARIAWRWLQPTPEAAATYSGFERRTARLVHGTLRALLVLMPILGIVTIAAVGRSPSLFGLELPVGFVPQSRDLHEVAEVAHALIGNFVLLPLIALHVAGALKHQLLDHAPAMRRMLVPQA